MEGLGDTGARKPVEPIPAIDDGFAMPRICQLGFGERPFASAELTAIACGNKV